MSLLTYMNQERLNFAWHDNFAKNWVQALRVLKPVKRSRSTYYDGPRLSSFMLLGLMWLLPYNTGMRTCVHDFGAWMLAGKLCRELCDKHNLLRGTGDLETSSMWCRWAGYPEIFLWWLIQCKSTKLL